MISFNTKKPSLSISLNGTGKAEFDVSRQKLDILDNLSNDKEYVVEIKEYRPKRSLNANAYAWLLIGEIAEKLNSTSDEVYLEALKQYGVSEMISVKNGISMEKYLKYYEKAGSSLLNGVRFVHYKVYKGSSEFDTKEMARFIDGIVEDAKTLGIDTRTPEQIALMEQEWKQ